MGKIKENAENDQKKKLVISQDMKLVKALAGNEKKIRDRALRNLKEWFKQRSTKMPFTEDDYLRIWKGLFCSMWMSDKPLVQEECAENIANLIHFTSEESALLFFKCGLKLLSIEWFGIDQWRLDKFLMLVRRMLRQALVFIKKHNWDAKLVAEFTRALPQTVLNGDNKCLGLTMHVTEIYLEELAKVSKGKLSASQVTDFLKPFIRYLATVDDDRQIKHVTKCVFHHLMEQSDSGLEHEACFLAWKKQGFPGGRIDVMEKMEVNDGGEEDDDDEDDDERDLDPRAGRVDVILPQLKFDTDSLLRLFHDFKFKKESTTIGKKALARLHQQFEKLSKGSYPLGITRVPKVQKDESATITKSIDRLMDFNRQLRQEKRQFNRKLIDEQIGQKPKKTKRVNGFDPTIFATKLNAFINKSERNLHLKRTPKRRKSALDPNWSYENSFRRNSGLWVVHKLNTTAESPAPNGVSPKTRSSPITNEVSFTSRSSPISNDVNHKANSNKSSPANAAWQKPLETGETEIFVPSNKFKAKMKAQGKDVNEFVERIMQTPNLVKNPFAVKTGKTPRSEKKVRIALKLNQSQEVHEHEAQLKSSPGIPYDANRRPVKPLLKPNYVKSPINPFYKRKFKL